MSTQYKSVLHQSAREWAARGFYVFPCVVGRKEPLPGSSGWKDGTLDHAQIDAWWSENPNYNIAVATGPSDSLVLDADPPLGSESLQKLLAEHGALPATLTTRTPRGGLHFWFLGKGASTGGKLGPNLDTRGDGGYALVPPSVIAPGEYPEKNPEGGTYGYVNGLAYVEAPAWINERLAVRVEHHAAAADTLLDTPGSIERARTLIRHYIEAEDVATQGRNGNDRAYKLFVELAALGLSHETSIEEIQPWNEACRPPFSQDELETFAENTKYMQNAPGAFAVQPAAEAFASYLSSDAAAKVVHVETVKRSKFYPMTLAEAAATKAPSWIIPGLIQANSFAVMAGKMKSFKTFLAVDLALGISTGTETFGFTPKRGTVVYAVGEGQWNLSHSLAPAWIAARQCREEPSLYIIPTVPKVIFPEDAEALIKQIEERKIRPDLVVIDTVSRSLGGLDENSAKDTNVFIAAVDLIRERLGCTVLALHHMGKDKDKGARGSTAIPAAADTNIEIERIGKSTFVSAFVRDQRNAPERELPYLFEGRSFGPSLAFFLTDAATFAAQAQTDNATSKKNVASALAEIGARGQANAQTVFVLAQHLASRHNEDAAKLVNRLKKEARKPPLNAYCDDTGLQWYITTL